MNNRGKLRRDNIKVAARLFSLAGFEQIPDPGRADKERLPPRVDERSDGVRASTENRAAVPDPLACGREAERLRQSGLGLIKRRRPR